MPNREETLAVFKICAAMAEDAIPASLCQDPLPLLAAVIGTLCASEESPLLPEEAKAPATEAIRFLAERLATLVSLVDPSAPSVNAT